MVTHISPSKCFICSQMVKMDGEACWDAVVQKLGPWRSLFNKGAESTLIYLCSLPTQQAQYLKRHKVQPLAPLSSGAFWPCQETLSKHHITQSYHVMFLRTELTQISLFLNKSHVSEVFSALPALQWALLAHVITLNWLYSTSPGKLFQEFHRNHEGIWHHLVQVWSHTGSSWTEIRCDFAQWSSLSPFFSSQCSPSTLIDLK